MVVCLNLQPLIEALDPSDTSSPLFVIIIMPAMVEDVILRAH
jgi:hypothetical protein